jgi:hypothetical protein
MTRFIVLVAISTLAAAVLLRPSADQRMAISVIVSVAAAVLVLRCLFTGKVVIAALFLGVLGAFTPFRMSPFSHAFISILDLATLALFTVTPMMLRKTLMPTVSSAPQGRL